MVLRIALMKMLARLRYLLEEGFEVAMLSAYDAASGSEERGTARMTYFEVLSGETRRMVSEEFSVTETEMELCSRLFLESRSN